ncbi:MAG: cysteine--tRNA ligase [Kiloniellales bacterium]
MPLRLYNTLSRRKERFEPLDSKRVRMYVCGPTVYDLPHIGNARPIVVFDVLYRLLRRLYGEGHVAYVRNITDVDDKINAAAQERGVSIHELTEQTTRAFHDDVGRLGALAPDAEPRATEHIPEMIELVERLLATGHAYEAEGHVLFHVPSMADYGRLSRHNRDDLIAGARVEVAPYKKDPTDFVLWKPSTPELPGWDSPWGRGRPGWHLECSAMSEKLLGAPFDIHGGGQDLIFPHHENEIAQSCSAHPDQGFANFWVHNGYVQVEGEKMAKSLGNVVTLRELLGKADASESEKKRAGETIRYALLLTHYRQPLDFTRAGLTQAEDKLRGLYRALLDTQKIDVEPATKVPLPVMAALKDDLNTWEAIRHLHELATELNKARRRSKQVEMKRSLLAAGEVLGFLQQDPEAWFQRVVIRPGTGQITIVGFAPTVVVTPQEKEKIKQLVEQRAAYRKARKFAEADRIRDELKSRGVVTLEDRPDPTSDRELME